ncbi:glycosyltransferase family 2 protein [Chryseobacterium sp. SIMBA_038]|uniref:glycosyltransferase family 2 protein n=1 Tax=Chryseobacterium sp. SIMBA_038 TaxID=3085780 RepID=UPI00397C2D77
MEKKDLVSIIVCSYNQGKYIEECLDSIKSQTYPNIQLIVADDASPDNSVDVFKNWLTENNYPAITHFHQKNTGLATVLNECIELVEGKYVKIIAADDFLHPESIEKCVTKLEDLGDEYGMAFTDTYAIDDNSNIIADIADYETTGNMDSLAFRTELIKGNRIAALTVLMRTKALQETGKYDAKVLVEDYQRWLKINEKYLIAYISEKLTYYRIHSSNISKAKSERIEFETLTLQIEFDKEGVAKSRINDRTQRQYFSGSKLPKEYVKLYNNYPFHIKRLGFALKYHLPVSLYKFLNKIF